MSKAEALVARFISGFPPSSSFSYQAGYYHDAYRSKEPFKYCARVMGTIFEREREYKKQSASYVYGMPSGLSADEELKYVYQNYCLKQALKFAFFGLGGCGNRASYAAIMLESILRDCGNQINLFSFSKRDQFVVFLADAEENRWVYDPFINPEMLYMPDEYREQILTKAYAGKPKALRAKKVNLVLRPEMSLEEKLTELMTQYASEAIDFGDKATLLDDPSFILSISAARPGGSQFIVLGDSAGMDEVVDVALQQLQSLRQKQCEALLDGASQSEASVAVSFSESGSLSQRLLGIFGPGTSGESVQIVRQMAAGVEQGERVHPSAGW